MSAATPSATAAPKRRPARRIALTLAAFLGLCAAWTVYDRWQMQREWREACAEADRLDPGWRWDDLTAARPAPPEGRNSAAHVFAANRLLPPGVKDRLLKAVIEYQRTPAQHRLAAQTAATLQEALSAAAPAVAEADQVAYCPEGRIEPPSSPLPLSHPYTFLYFDVIKWVMVARLILQTELGDPDGALTAARAMIHASRPLAQRHILAHVQLAGAVRLLAARGVERVLAQGEPSPAALDEARRLLEKEIDRPLMLSAFRGERATIEDTLRAYDDGRLSWRQVADSRLFATLRPWSAWGTAGRWLDRLTGSDFCRGDAVAKLRHLNWLIECLKESPDALRAQADELAVRQSQLPRAVAIWAGNMARYDADVRRNEGLFRAAVVALAAEQFRQATGRWPTSLGELVPRYLAAVPCDPIDGQPLRLARRPDGIVIYSIGPDGKDDGGAVDAPSPRRAADVGIRLWDVAQRRQPPLPPKAPAAGTKKP